MSSPPRKELKRLGTYLAQLEAKFITKHLNQTTLSSITSDERLDVAAYFVLSHGALEGYVENVSTWVLDRIEKNWLSPKNRATRSTVGLLLHHGYSQPDPDKDPEHSVFDTIRHAINAEKRTHSHKIHSNNGSDVKHLRSLLIPLGVDVPDDPILTGSLHKLVERRHEWAHQSRVGAKKDVSPSDARDIVRDCFTLAEKICDNIARLRLN